MSFPSQRLHRRSASKQNSPSRADPLYRAEAYARPVAPTRRAVREHIEGLGDAVRDQVQAVSQTTKDQLDQVADAEREQAEQAKQEEREYARQVRNAERQKARQARQAARERYQGMTKSELADELAGRELPKSGTIDERIERLVDADTK
jgi:hypothetical protein